MYFGNYRKLVYLAQAPKPSSEEQARAVASRMGLEFEIRRTGYGTLGTSLAAAVTRGAAQRGHVAPDAAARRTEEVVAWRR